MKKAGKAQKRRRNSTLTGLDPILQTRWVNDRSPDHFSSIESRRSASSMRRMTPVRRLYYFLGLPVLRGLIKLLTATYRIERVAGEEHIEPFLDGKAVCAPAYWHQHHIIGSMLIRRWLARGFKPRGSANQSGALALRDQQRMMKSGFSIVTTADGPRGPQHEFKSGTVLMARVAGVPILPIGCAADRAWYLEKRWDCFMIPKPFARIAIAVGEPVPVPRDIPLDALEPVRLNVQERVMSLMTESELALEAD
jgi:lysophospholipid acyltransferase (LPLAT)-like uncharacterized protein